MSTNPRPTRRNFLRILGGGTVLAATGATGFVASRTPSKALAPWSAAPSYADPRKRALAHALLAPNPHNRQPWLVELTRDDGLILHRDETRELPQTDPFHRQLFIGLGCFIEQMVIAASAEGYNVDLQILPEGETGPIAQARFIKGADPDPLALQIAHRRSNKLPYSETPLSPAQSDALAPFATILTDQDMVSHLRDLTWNAFQVETLTPHTLEESVDLMRIGKAEINANPDGIDMRSPMLDALRRLGMLPKEALMKTEGAAFENVMADYKNTFYATPAYAVLTSDGNSRADQIEVGRKWLRLNLKTTEMGLGLHPISQALQEYPEMAKLYGDIHEQLARPGQTVQMLGRLGIGPEAPQTPRWSLEARLLNG